MHTHPSNISIITNLGISSASPVVMAEWKLFFHCCTGLEYPTDVFTQYIHVHKYMNILETVCKISNTVMGSVRNFSKMSAIQRPDKVSVISNNLRKSQKFSYDLWLITIFVIDSKIPQSIHLLFLFLGLKLNFAVIWLYLVDQFEI